MSFRAVFIRPSNRTGSAYLSKWGFLPAPLGLLALAGEIKRIPDSKVKIIDMEADNISLDEAIIQILDLSLTWWELHFMPLLHTIMQGI